MFLEILISFVLLVIFWIRNRILYIKNYGNPTDLIFYRSTIETYSVLHEVPGKPIFVLSENFFNYTANLILKFVFLVISLLLYHFIDSSILSIIISGLFLIIAIGDWNVYRKRFAFYKNISNDFTKEAYHGMFKACICSPLYQTVLYIIVFLIS